jgi:hypothetical protein
MVVENHANPQIFRRIRNFSAIHPLHRCDARPRCTLAFGSGRLTSGYAARTLHSANPTSSRAYTNTRPSSEDAPNSLRGGVVGA